MVLVIVGLFWFQRLDKGAGCATSDSVKLECKSHACPICGKEYSKRGLLLGHLSRKHYFRELLRKFEGGETDGEGKMVCPLCSKAFRQVVLQKFHNFKNQNPTLFGCRQVASQLCSPHGSIPREGPAVPAKVVRRKKGEEKM